MLTAAQLALYDLKSPNEGIGVLLNQKRGVVKAVYDFAVNAGAIGTLNLKDDQGTEILFPDNMIVTQAYIDPYTAMTSTGGTGTIALSVVGADDLLAAVDADTLSTTITAGVPVGTAATMVKLTSALPLVLTIGTAALTAGAFNFYVEFVLSD
jgi:hypothetical protein